MYLDLLKYSLEKEGGIVKENNWTKVGKRGDSELDYDVGKIRRKEFDEFLKYFDVCKENLRKENEVIPTYRMIDIGNRDIQKENLNKFLKYLEVWKRSLDHKNYVKNTANWMNVGKRGI